VLEAIVEPRFCTIAILILTPVLRNAEQLTLLKCRTQVRRLARFMQSNIEACRVFALSLARVTQPSAISDLHARKSTTAFLPTGVRLFAYEARAAYSGASPPFIGAGLCRGETRRALIQSGGHSADAARLLRSFSGAPIGSCDPKAHVGSGIRRLLHDIRHEVASPRSRSHAWD
jgi:hypothetical protein